MSSGNGANNGGSSRSAQMDTKREEFRKYLEKEGVLEYLTKSLVSLYEAEKPNSALDYLKNNFSGKETEILQLKVSNLTRESESLTKENQSLKDKVAELEAKLADQQKEHQEQLQKERANFEKEKERVAAEASVTAAESQPPTKMAVDEDATTTDKKPAPEGRGSSDKPEGEAEKKKAIGDEAVAAVAAPPPATELAATTDFHEPMEQDMPAQQQPDKGAGENGSAEQIAAKAGETDCSIADSQPAQAGAAIGQSGGIQKPEEPEAGADSAAAGKPEGGSETAKPDQPAAPAVSAPETAKEAF